MCVYIDCVIFAIGIENNVKTLRGNPDMQVWLAMARMTCLQLLPELQRPRFLAVRTRACRTQTDASLEGCNPIEFT